MIDIDDTSTIGSAFEAAAARWPDRPFIAAPANPGRDYHPHGVEITYSRAAVEVARLSALYADAGYGAGHRVALMLDSRPEHFLHKLALGAIGACIVPVNPDYRAGEIAYLVDHSKADLVVALGARRAQLDSGLAQAARKPPVEIFEELGRGLARAREPRRAQAPAAATPASILYTSGTTGRPKGCILSHHYEICSGHWYATRGGLAAMRDGEDRLYNPLPLYHVNASVTSFLAMMVRGGCQIQADRFQPTRWWPEVIGSRASIVHYLGVIAPMLLNQPPAAQDRAHGVRFGAGAGVEPQLHAVFEARFGFPLVELWGMTEMVRVLIDNGPVRQVGTRAFGRAVPGLDARVVDDHDAEVPDGTPGELVVRHDAERPRHGAFSGYLDDDAATEAAWRGGWFHTGDTVVRAPDGMFHFVDRKKNIIRRSGENIAAAEVEALLQAHDAVAQVAVLAAPDEIREEEVLACVVPAEGTGDAALARTLFDWCNERLAYYKAPGWVWFTDRLPTTGTQKIQKHQIFPAGTDPRTLPGMHDLRGSKKRSR